MYFYIGAYNWKWQNILPCVHLLKTGWKQALILSLALIYSLNEMIKYMI